MNRIYFTALAIAIASAMALLAEPSFASTALEKKILTYPMPHTQLPIDGPRVKVHYTRIHSNPQGHKTVEAFAKLLKEQAALCAVGRRKRGLSANPPGAIPDYAAGFHKDSYWARNREITYERRHGFQLNEDCSITEDEHLEAVLTSSKGTCKVDFTNKTATGNCDSKGHANAAASLPVPRMSNAETNAMMDAMASGPKTSAYAKQIKALVGNGMGATGRKKTILGIECEIMTVALGPMQGTQCIAYPPATSAAGDAGVAGLLLDLTNADFGSATAVEAKLDADVSSTLFAPYARGFKILAE